jgi:hypothetical protein
MAWDGPGAKRRVFEMCDGNVACISRAFLWRAPDADARTQAAYSLGFADVVDGRLVIVPRGIAATAGGRGVDATDIPEAEKMRIRARICAVYERVRATYEDWPECPMAMTASLRADASGDGIEGVIAIEGQTTGDNRRIAKGALTWDEGPWPLVFDLQDMDHTGATVGTINEIKRREGGVIWARGALSESENPDTQAMVARAAELFDEGAVGVSVSLDNTEDDEQGEVVVTTKGRIRSVAIVDEAAFAGAKMALVAAADPAWFADPKFGNGSTNHKDANGDDRLVWQEPEVDGEEEQFGCPLTITEDGHIFGHAALWYRCHVGHVGTCVRPPREPASYRGYLTGERIPGIPTGPLVFKTRHAPDHLAIAGAEQHYAHTGYAPADVTIGPDAYGIWVSGGLRADATEADIEILRGSSLSGDWRPAGRGHRLVGILAVSGPGFRVARALAASGALITIGPGCTSCEDSLSLEDEVASLRADVLVLQRIVAQSLVAGLSN